MSKGVSNVSQVLVSQSSTAIIASIGRSLVNFIITVRLSVDTHALESPFMSIGFVDVTPSNGIHLLLQQP